MGVATMARITFKNGDEYALKLSRLETNSDEIAKKAIYEGAKVVADAIKANLYSLSAGKFRYLRDGDVFVNVPAYQKADLIASFGIASIDKDSYGNWNTKLGFDGYGRVPTDSYPRGLPNNLLARSIESGSSVRVKAPFVRPAVNKSKGPALDAMRKIIDEETKKLMGGK